MTICTTKEQLHQQLNYVSSKEQLHQQLNYVSSKEQQHQQLNYVSSKEQQHQQLNYVFCLLCPRHVTASLHRFLNADLHLR